MHENPENGPLFEIYSPKDKCIGILSIPHSGLWIPKEFEEYITNDQSIQNQDVDYEVHQLIHIDQLTEAGILVVKSNVHRICCDLNRSPDKAILNWKNNSKGKQIVLNEPSSTEEQGLIAKYHSPYFTTIDSAINALNKAVSFIDLHSMPSHPTEYHLKTNPDQAKTRPEFCLSDQHGKSCSKEFINSCVAEFRSSGFEAVINEPYVGGHITQYFMERDFNNIQIEIRRNMYMNEETYELKDIKEFKDKLTEILIKQFKNFY